MLSRRYPSSAALIALLTASAACGPPEPNLPPPTLIADPPPTEDGRMPGAGQADFDRGVAYIEAEAWGEAIQQFDRALSLAPDNAEAESYRAFARERSGDGAGAEAGYRRALELDPKLVHAAINLGAMYLEEPSRPKLAIEVLQKAVGHDPGAWDARQNLAYAYRLVGDHARSAEHYRQALKLKDSPRLRFALGDLLLEAGRVDEGVTELRKALPGVRDDFASVFTVAELLRKAKAYDGCVEAFTMALELKKGEPRLLLPRGICRHRLHDEPGARADFQAAIDADGKNAPAYYYLGMSYLQDKMRSQASEALQKARALGRGTRWGKLAAERLRELGGG